MSTTTATTSAMSRKILIPLATLVAAGAVAVGSGATWTSTTDNAISVTAGDLLHVNSQDGATLTLDEIKPGDSMSGSVTVENTGSTDSTLDLAVSGARTDFSNFLTISVSENGVSLYDGPFSGLALGFAQTDIDFASGDSVTYDVSVALDTAATEADQLKVAGAAFTWTQTQVDGEVLGTNWVS